jgi:glutamate 5-kinase
MDKQGYLTGVERLVIKVGSALIAPDGNGCCAHYLLPVAQFICQCRLRGIEVVLVSSGSIAAGKSRLSVTGDDDVFVKKAMAAAGQSEMMAIWGRLFDFSVSQFLHH